MPLSSSPRVGKVVAEDLVVVSFNILHGTAVGQPTHLVHALPLTIRQLASVNLEITDEAGLRISPHSNFKTSLHWLLREIFLHL